MTDMYASCGDPELASLSGTTKQVVLDEKYGQPKEFFHVVTRQTLCQAELAEKQIDREECILAREYCQQMM